MMFWFFFPSDSPVSASVAATLGALTSTSTTAIEVSGSVTATLASVTLSATLSPSFELSVDSTLAALTCSARGDFPSDLRRRGRVQRIELHGEWSEWPSPGWAPWE